jgi:CubicO group peptidase (beta-lactamase class C family)
MSFELPRADKPEDVGLSSERLQRLTDTLKADIDKGIVPGAVALIARRGKIAYEIALGYRDREAGTAMEVDTIFRIASMTKPFTSLAAMMLAEEGKLLIADPVAHFIPEFAGLKVVTDSDNTSAKTLVTEPCRRQMTVQDLLRHTSGFTYGHLTGPLLKQAYEATNVSDEKQTNAEMAAKLAMVPLAYQPGSTWQYGMSTDVLGRVVESASGMDLDRFVIERICKPLGLKDTSFGPMAYARAAQPQVDAASGKRPPMRDPTIRSNWISGGSALLSTARDYVRFCQMLLNGGEFGGTRFVSPATVTLMTSDHLTPETRRSPSTPVLFGALAPSPELGLGFGLGFAVRTHAGRNPLPGSVGDFSWSGVTGTYFWIDPQQDLIAILLMQAPAQRMHYRYLMRTMVYQAIVQ